MIGEDYGESINKKQVDVVDFPTILAMISLIAIGLISIYSATYDVEMSKFFIKQSIFAGVGLVAMVSMIFMPQHWLRLATPALYGIGIILLILVLFIGLKINGQRCWISLGGFQFQPSEFAKISTLLMVGKYMESKGVNIKNIRDLGILCGIVLLPAILVLLEKDTGTTSVFMAMLVGVILWCGGDLFLLFVLAVIPIIGITSMYSSLYQNKIPLYVLLALVSAGVLALRRSVVITAGAIIFFVVLGFSVGSAFYVLPAHQQDRIQTFFEPEKNPKEEGYHVLQSMMAIGSGGITGKGFMQGTLTQLRYIPEQWTDFIFDVPGEEFGFIGSVTVLGLLTFLILRILRLARIAREEFASTIAFGLATILLYHTIVNIGMTIGVFPVMGIPLPFLSSGGTALIANMTIVGILLNFYRTRQKAQLMM